MDQIINSNVRAIIEAALLDPPERIELEARFTDYHMEKGIDIRTYQRIVKNLSNHKSEQVYSTDRILKSENLRYTTIINPGGNVKRILIRKESLPNFPKFVEFYKFRISLSTEKEIEVTKEYASRIDNASREDLLIRIKNRLSFFISDDLRIDITKVDESEGNLSKPTRYELELELLNPRALGAWYTQILEMLRLIQNTEIVYTLEEYKTLLSNTNKYLGNPNETRLNVDMKVLMDARNLKFRDLEFGGLVGNNTVSYRVTVKSDGERKLMVVSRNGIWLIWNNEVNKIYQGDDFTARYEGYIFDGELLPLESRKEVVSQKYWYLIFDLINYNDTKIIDKSIRDKPHSMRMQAAQRVKDHIVENQNDATRNLARLLLVETKRFYSFRNMEAFYENMKVADDHRADVPYEEDGFIFVPDEAPYKRTTAKMGERNLTRFADICKWKPADKITIDFAILRVATKEGERIKIQGYSSRKMTKLIEYRTNEYFVDPIFRRAFSSLNRAYFRVGNYNYVYLKEFDVTGIHSNNIVEFSWDGVRNVYKARILNTSKMTSIGLLPNKLASKENFVIELIWKDVDDKNRIMELHHTQRFDPDYPSRNYVDIDRPIDEQHELLKGLPSGFIVEFKWDRQINKFVPVRLRPNKRVPNSIETINDNLQMIEDPIELKTLLGKDIRLMRKSHNSIKRQLFENAPGEYILDLGFGRGGDASKMRNYKKIIGVEPNPDHIIRAVELIKKIYELPDVKVIRNIQELERTDLSRERFLILNTKAENHEFITAAVNKFFGRPADVISMMLSLSFFWRDQQTLTDLITTISNNLKVGGIFTYMTIDGDKVKQVFDPAVKGAIVDELSLLNGDITMRYVKSSPSSGSWKKDELKVRFKGTIVGEGEEEQTEYLVMLDDLRSFFGNIGIVETMYEFANKEQFLNDSEKVLTNLYSYGTFVRRSQGNILSKWRSPFLFRGDAVKSLNTPINSLTGMFVYELKVTPCKWYKGTIYRSSQPVLRQSMLSLILSILRLRTQEGYSGTANVVLENLEKNMELLKQSGIEITTPAGVEVNMENLIIALGNFYKVDISLVEITSNNLIPIVAKIGNYDNAIVIGRTDNGFENIGELTNNGIKFIFGSKVNIDHFVLSLAGISLLDKIKDENKAKEYSEKYNNIIYKGEKNFGLIVEMKKLTS